MSQNHSTTPVDAMPGGSSPASKRQYFGKLQLSHHRHLLSLLDGVLDRFEYDVERCHSHFYDPNLSPSAARARVRGAALRSVMQESPRKSSAGDDKNILLLNGFKTGELKDTVAEVFEEALTMPPRGKLSLSGRMWYPLNGYMGWHTNQASPGYRLYCSHAREPGKSFFRYRDPSSGSIKTSWDGAGWEFRLFQISSEPLWHAVYSETDRISLGFKLADLIPARRRTAGKDLR